MKRKTLALAVYQFGAWAQNMKASLVFPNKDILFKNEKAHHTVII